jgi:DNA-binding NarL/FixJ family response regulator
MIRVILADDHHLVRGGIRALLDRADDIEVTGEAADGQQAVELTEQLAPDVLVMDIAMPRLDGIQATERIRALGLVTKVVILSMHADKTLVRQALRAGARGYLLKSSVTDEMLVAIRAAMRGEIYLSPAISATLVDEFLDLERGSGECDPFDQLTPREREVLQLVAEGHTNTAIAGLMNISVRTVEKHRSSLMSKLGVRDLAGLLRAAIKHGLVFLEE